MKSNAKAPEIIFLYSVTELLFSVILMEVYLRVYAFEFSLTPKLNNGNLTEVICWLYYNYIARLGEVNGIIVCIKLSR